MKPFKSFQLALAGLAMLTAATVSAQEKPKKIASSRDWTLYEIAIGSSVLCYAQNDGESNLFLNVRKVKNNPNSPIEFMLQMTKNKTASTGAIASIAGLGSTIAMPDLDGNKVSFVGIPKNLVEFINLMKSTSKMKIKIVGGSKVEETDISTKGFADIVAKLQELCNGNLPLINNEFQNNFVNAVADNIDPLQIDPNEANQARGVYYAAYTVAVELTTAREDLNKVLVKYQPLTTELDTNRAQAGRISGTDLPNARNELASNQQTQRNSQAEIARVDAALPGLNAKVQASQKALDQARAVIAPLQPEYNRLTSNLSSAQSTLDSSENRLAFIEGRLRDGANQIANLDSEARSIESRLPSKRAEADRARRIYNDAEFQRSRYNVSFERDQRLRRNFEYSRLENERRQLQNDLSRAQNDAENIRRERDRIQRDLNVCLSQPLIEQLVPGPSVGEEPPPGGGLVPGPSEPPPSFDPGPSEPPTPVRDCSQLQASLNNANNMLAQKQNEVRQIDNRLDSVDASARRIERQVDLEVQREYQILSDRAEDARRSMQIAEDSVRSDDNRLAQIRQSDIPRLEREQSDLRAERPSVQSAISQARADVARLSNELARFKSANDWDRKAAAVEARSSQLDIDENARDTAERSKSNAQATLQTALVRESQIKQNIDSLTSQLNALNQRAAVLQDGLKNLPAERAPIDARISSGEANLKARQEQLLNLVR